MAQNISDNINVFEPDKDLLDRAVEGYEQNVPLLAQIGAGFTPPGIAIDIAEMTKYGRDAAREFGQGNIGRGFANAGIAGLSALGTIPLVGDLIKPGGKSLIKRTFLNENILAKQDTKDLTKIVKDSKLTDAQKAQQIKNHPAIVRAEKTMNEVPPTKTIPGYGTKEFVNTRQFDFDGTPVVGYKNAAKELYMGGKRLPYIEEGLDIPKVFNPNTGDKVAILAIGPPAAGKSAMANPVAIKYNATIIDPDEAKKALPEFRGGVGANSVHHESKLLSEMVQNIAIKNGDNIVIPTVGADPTKLRYKIQQLKNKGYKVNLVLTELDPDTAFVRMNQRFLSKNRLINSDAAESYRGKPEVTYNKLKKENVADGYGKIDTNTRVSGPRSNIVTEDTAGIFDNTNLRLPEGRRRGGTISSDYSIQGYGRGDLPRDETFTVMVD
tara:strand:- start:47 stop:1360 length:1314 start_codon:yes stop_codon:yes gene_type:complete